MELRRCERSGSDMRPLHKEERAGIPSLQCYEYDFLVEGTDDAVSERG